MHFHRHSGSNLNFARPCATEISQHLQKSHNNLKLGPKCHGYYRVCMWNPIGRVYDPACYGLLISSHCRSCRTWYKVNAMQSSNQRSWSVASNATSSNFSETINGAITLVLAISLYPCLLETFLRLLTGCMSKHHTHIHTEALLRLLPCI